MTNTPKPLYAARMEELLTRFCGADPAERLNGDTVARILASVCAERERADATATELAALKAALRDTNVFNSDDVQYLRDLASDVNRDDSQREGAALLLAVMGQNSEPHV